MQRIIVSSRLETRWPMQRVATARNSKGRSPIVQKSGHLHSIIESVRLTDRDLVAYAGCMGLENAKPLSINRATELEVAGALKLIFQGSRQSTQSEHVAAA